MNRLATSTANRSPAVGSRSRRLLRAAAAEVRRGSTPAARATTRAMMPPISGRSPLAPISVASGASLRASASITAAYTATAAISVAAARV